ncbi:Histidine kinase with GAF domain [Frankia canadensis]|uniref:Histidine kinase with GAF domain n=1 Tax=Frankia canadensis TaxID=1836972 RepID=A0A2I2KYY6_9ACTN|nr:GAF domain-containing protein [Frankia canadensis]SNQ50867.1 Histidine kinase with GAF domain [Frankia canadensis]SOU58157.1 Histidine kinase with GAF domain [Frankia canadensis]
MAETPAGGRTGPPAGDDRSRLDGLLGGIVEIAQERSLPVTLCRVVEAAIRLVGAEGGALGLLGEAGEVAEVFPADAAEAGDAADGAGALLGLLPMGRGLVAESLRDRCPPRLAADSAFLHVPIAVRGEVFGALLLVGRGSSGAFTAPDEALVGALAAAAGFAIGHTRLYEATRRRQAWLHASAEITTALLSVADPQEALGLVARRARQVTAARLAVILVPDVEDVEGLVVGVVDGEGEERLRGRILRHEARLLDAMRTGRAALVGADRGPLFDAGTPDPPAEHGMVVPLMAGGRTLGILVLGTEGSAVPFSGPDLEMAAAFAGQAALSLELARIHRDRERLAVFEERDRIARDLHDVVIQRLFATGLQLQSLARSVDGPATARLHLAADELDQTIADIRQTIFSLTLVDDEGGDLAGEIRAIVAQTERALGITPQIRVDGPIERRVPASIRPHMLAALREALSNIARHARATRIDVLLRVTGVDVLVEVRDDGCGPGGASRSSGLANLRRRAVDLGGRMGFGPGESGIGTTVTWQVPLITPPAALRVVPSLEGFPPR